MNIFKFQLLRKSGLSRIGKIQTAHGSILTPAFMPVGTCGTVKAMMPESVALTGADIILGNTYHLMLRPTSERISRFGGLHRFMNWPGPILTDSGGFQVMSLAKIRTITENGVIFQSHIDGSNHTLTPELSVKIQHNLNSDITMSFDECTEFPVSEKIANVSMHLSMRWAKRSHSAFVKRLGYGIFGIVQGSIYPDLRKESIEILRNINFDGYAIGGLAVGEGQEEMFRILSIITPSLPEDQPRYLMGVGTPSDIVGCVQRGIDMFDCVIPTRSGRTGQAFTRYGTVNIRNARHQNDSRPLDDACNCPACRNYSRGYLHHLTRSKEILGLMLMTWHNLQYYQDLMSDLREAIIKDRLINYVTNFYNLQTFGDIEQL